MAGRTELLGWLNSTLDLRLGKVEETASGAVACQIMDALHPGAVPMKKVDYNAKNEYEYINNYKVLQEVFTKQGIEKHVEVSKLIKGRPLDNMEFMQWLKTYFDQQTGGRGINDYDGAARRALCKTGDVRGSGAASALVSRTAAGTTPTAPSPAAAATPHHGAASYAGRLPGGGTGAGAAAAAAVGGAQPPGKRAPSQKLFTAGSGSLKAAASGGGGGGGVRSRGPSDDGAVEQLQAEVATWRLTADTATKEKDFYWSKLRAIELLCNTCPDVAVLRVVEDILYAPSQEEGERLLGEAMADLEAQGLAAPAPAAPEDAAAEGAAGGDGGAEGAEGQGGDALAVAAQEVGCAS